MPKGTSIIISFPLAPFFFEPPPGFPFSAIKCFLYFKCNKVQSCLFPLKIICPPLPPSPPSGPPYGTNFSLLKCLEPSPPFPDLE